MTDRAVYDVSSYTQQDSDTEIFRRRMRSLGLAKAFARILSKVERTTVVVRGPGAAGLIWLLAVYHMGDEIGDDDDA